MPQAVLLLIGLQLAGDVAARLSGLPVPGMVLGPAALFAILCVRAHHLGREHAVPPALSSVAGGLHAALGPRFVPAGAGISLAPKSATAAVAMAVSAETGGIPALTAVVTILAGIAGAVFGPGLLDRLGIADAVARGFGIGLASHGIGTAAGLAMGLNAVLTALIVPAVLAVPGLAP